MTKKNITPDSEEKKALKVKGKKALIVNIIFFLALFVVMLMVPKLGVVPAGILIVLVFIASLLYIYRF